MRRPKADQPADRPLTGGLDHEYRHRRGRSGPRTTAVEPDHRALRPLDRRRKALLAREKELTHLRDEVARERRELPWVRVDKDYVFDTPEGRRTLAELFDGRSQLLV